MTALWEFAGQQRQPGWQFGLKMEKEGGDEQMGVFYLEWHREDSSVTCHVGVAEGAELKLS